MHQVPGGRRELLGPGLVQPQPSEPADTITAPSPSTKATRTVKRTTSTRIAAVSTSTNTKALLSNTKLRSSSLINSLSLSLTTGTKLSTSTSSFVLSHPAPPPGPATYFGSVIYSQQSSSPTPPPPPPPPAPHAPFNPPLVAVVLVGSGAALIGLVFVIVLRRFCARNSYYGDDRAESKDSPMFGGRGNAFDEKYTVMGSIDSWEDMQASLTKGMGRMSTAVEPQQKRLSLSQRGIGLEGFVDGWNLTGNGEGGHRGATTPNFSANAFHGSSTSLSSLSHDGRFGHQHGGSSGPLFNALYPQGNHTRLQVPSSQAVTVSSPSALSSVSISSDTSILPFDPLKVPLTQPLRLNLKRPDQPITTGDISRPILQSTTNLAAQNLVEPKPPVKSILKHRPQPSTSASAQFSYSGEKNATRPTDMASSASVPSAPYSAQSSLSAMRRPDLSKPVVRPSHIKNSSVSQYRPTSGRPPARAPLSQSDSSSSVTAYSSQGESSASTATGPGFSYGLDFPLPPSTFTTISSSGSIKPSTSKKRISVASMGFRKSEIGGSGSGALANVGDLMMRGFGDSDLSGDETSDVEASVVTATVKRVAPPTAQSLARKAPNSTTVGPDAYNAGTTLDDSSFRFPPLPPQPPKTSVPSIMITATSADSLKNLNKRLSRAAVGAKQLQDVNNDSDKILPPSNNLYPSGNFMTPASSYSRFSFDESGDDQSVFESRITTTRPSSAWAPLSQMAFEQAEPNYRSATYSIYNMYQEDHAVSPPPPNAHKERDISEYHTAPKTPKVTTMSTIYSGYGIGGGNGNGDEEDIGSSFAKEIGAKLGQIGI